MRKLWYVGLERIESRYSHQLTDWNVRHFKDLGIDYHIVEGSELPSVKGRIVTGSVLDAHGRTYYAMTQMANVVALLKAGKMSDRDCILVEDMFTPGLESLAYIFNQTAIQYQPRVYVRCLAQTVDPDDFVHRTGMFDWMRHFELMLDSFVDGILVASEELVANLKIAGFKAPIYVTGLPFNKDEVRARVPTLTPLMERPKVVSFASRWDSEKQPQFFLDVIKYVHEKDSTIKFQILTGNKKLKSNDPEALTALKNTRSGLRPGTLVVREGLTKNEYYSHLANSRLLFNCALQDWVSNTVSEADTFECMTLFPAYRSFPETLFNDRTHLYLPWSVEDAAEKLIALVNGDLEQTNIGAVSSHQHQSIPRTLDVLQGNGTPYRRWGQDYRKYVARVK